MATIQSIAGESGEHPDVALVERVRAGDLSAYDTLVRKYERQIFRIAQHITQNREDAEDVMQDAFLKAYEKLDQFQGNAKFYTWLVRIAVNESLMRLRKRRTSRTVSMDEDIETEEGKVRAVGNSAQDRPGSAARLPHRLRSPRCGGALHRGDGRNPRPQRACRQVPPAARPAAVARALEPAFPPRRKTRPATPATSRCSGRNARLIA